MTDSNNPWREKYRQALTQQEQLEKTISAQQGLLQRVVSAMASAAEGRDNGIDERIQAIKASVKHNDVAAFDRMLKSLPRVVEEAEQRQQQHWQEVNQALVAIAGQVQQQSPDANLKPAIKQFKKQLPKSADVIPATLKRLLEQLAQLQQQALEQAPKNQTSLFDKFFKSSQPEESIATSEQQSSTTPATDAAILEGELVTEPPVANADSGQNPDQDLTQDPSQDTGNYDRQRSLPEALLQVAHADQSPPAAVPHAVAVILLELLDEFKTQASTQYKATKARQRIESGLRWFELAPTLEDIRDFVLQAYLDADKDYRRYLERLHGELSEILRALGLSRATEESLRLAADQLQSELHDEMTNLNQALTDHNDINQLKNSVTAHVQQLQTSLATFKHQTSEPANDDSLATQLQTLIGKVQQMEQNERDIRARLEQEQQKALTDSLTGLPNREAYQQKLYDELQRWQRYGHGLSLAVLDIDFFKKINDNYGHQTGDKVLKIVANTVAKQLREVDFMARFGGEEFVLLLPETSAEDALVMLNRIRETLASAPFRYQQDKIQVTVSIGIAEFNDGDDADTVFVRADEALYEAKEGGRNQCRTK